jgi:hypothetical protein
MVQGALTNRQSGGVLAGSAGMMSEKMLPEESSGGGVVI